MLLQDAERLSKRVDFNRRPFIAIWETTQACDLACVHCRAEAQPDPLSGELSHFEGCCLIHQVAKLGAHVMVLSGGDPLKRRDLFDLIRYGKFLGLRMGTIPAATDLLTESAVCDLKRFGLDQMALSLDACAAADHDSFRGVSGSFDKTLRAIEWAHRIRLPLQINTVIGKHNFERLDDLIHFVEQLGIVFWEVFFLVPTGRGVSVEDLSAAEYEMAFEKLYALTQRASFIVKITEAPHFKRYYIQRRMQEADFKYEPRGNRLPEELFREFGPRGSIGMAPAAVNSGKGYVFISCQGDVFPSGFLSLAAGNIRESELKSLYRDSELFQNLRSPDLLKGRCGVCEYRGICGGSRSRAYAETGDYLAEESRCVYVPKAVDVSSVTS